MERIGCLNDGVFAEFGVGDGTENNTLILKALGWKGFWVGAQDLAFEVKQPNATFTFTKEWITLDNITALAAEGLKNLGCNGIDVLSLDLDGNDLYLVEALLKAGHVPKLLVVEYNAKFIPPVKWQIDYDPGHTWQCDDYFGASLASFDELFRRYRYRLVCCNSQTGSNAFFVRDKYSQAFADVPTEIADIYVPPNYFPLPWIGHRPNLKTIARLFS